MMSPVTSTSVATKGAEAVAGSRPMRLSSSGIIEPETVPHSTMKRSDTATLAPIQPQYSP